MERLRLKSQVKLVQSAHLKASLLKNIKIDSHELPEHGSPESHLRYYANPLNNAAFEFLDHCSENKDSSLKSESIDHTILSNDPKMPVVIKAQSNFANQISWGLSSICGVNKWPHPLA